MVKCQLGSGGARIQVVSGLALSPGVFSASHASPEKREVCSNLSPWIFISPALLLKSCAAILPVCVRESSKQEGNLQGHLGGRLLQFSSPQERVLSESFSVSSGSHGWLPSVPFSARHLCVWKGMKVCLSDRVCYTILVCLRT